MLYLLLVQVVWDGRGEESGGIKGRVHHVSSSSSWMVLMVIRGPYGISHLVWSGFVCGKQRAGEMVAVIMWYV